MSLASSSAHQFIKRIYLEEFFQIVIYFHVRINLLRYQKFLVELYLDFFI
jgi:hypothetical protein